jgi:hypothetical protein
VIVQRIERRDRTFEPGGQIGIRRPVHGATPSRLLPDMASKALRFLIQFLPKPPR